MAGSSLWKTIFLPPLVALLIYLLSIYIILPLYRRRVRYSNYLPLPLSTNSSTPSNPQSLLNRTRDRILSSLSPFTSGTRWQRRGSTSSSVEYFGDEELEEGYPGGGDEVLRSGREAGEERRLSRELEVGFRDDSDEENGVEGGQRDGGRARVLATA
ncbi:hypothetical protein MMC24_007035 [Lignoscripta atroalba]|nr:hypothetical protein [Lignoscripta atroalba]